MIKKHTNKKLKTKKLELYENLDSANDFEDNSFIIKLLSKDALLIPIITLCIYSLCFIYQIPTLLAFNIPLQFINISISHIGSIVMAILLIYGVFAVFGTIQILILTSFGVDKKWKELFFISSITLSLIGYIQIGKYNDLGSFAISAIIPFGSITGLICLLLFLKENANNQFKKVLYVVNMQVTKKFFDTYTSFINFFGFKSVLLLANYFMLIVLFIQSGNEQISKQTHYYVINNTPSCVIVYQTGERAICASFDGIKKEVDTKFTIINFSDQSKIQLSYENIGPLSLKPSPTPTSKPTTTPAITKTPFQTFTPTAIPTITATQ